VETAKLALIAGSRKVLQKEKEKKSDLDGKCLLLFFFFVILPCSLIFLPFFIYWFYGFEM
jgi:hypothetical protein